MAVHAASSNPSVLLWRHFTRVYTWKGGSDKNLTALFENFEWPKEADQVTSIHLVMSEVCSQQNLQWRVKSKGP